MKDQEKIDILKRCFEDTIWMAIRYADGRHTYAPTMVRDSIKEFQQVFPEWEPQEDQTIKPPKPDEDRLWKESDYLYDLFRK